MDVSQPYCLRTMGKNIQDKISRKEHVMKKNALFVMMMVIIYAFISCGGASGEPSNNIETVDVPSTSASATHEKVFYSIVQVLSVVFGGEDSSDSAQENSDSNLVFKALVKQLTSYSIDCKTGDIGVESNGELPSEVGSSIQGTITLNSCSKEINELNTCSITPTVEGSIICEIAKEADSNGTYTKFTCQTSAECSGITVVLDGVNHQYGGLIVSKVRDDQGGEPQESSGTVCIDGNTYDAGVLMQLEKLEC